MMKNKHKEIAIKYFEHLKEIDPCSRNAHPLPKPVSEALKELTKKELEYIYKSIKSKK